MCGDTLSLQIHEAYCGSIADISQLEFMLGKAKGYGYRNIGFILDRGYFSKDNIRQMDEYGYDFVIMVKGMAFLVNELVLKHRGTFEDDRECNIRKHHVYGMTVKHKLYVDDEKDRYFHIYHSTGKEHGEREDVEEHIERMYKVLQKQYGTDYELKGNFKNYFDPFYGKDGILSVVKEKKDVVKRELRLCGYFVIVTSEKMTAEEAIDLYYSRDTSENYDADMVLKPTKEAGETDGLKSIAPAMIITNRWLQHWGQIPFWKKSEEELHKGGFLRHDYLWSPCCSTEDVLCHHLVS